MSKPKKEILRDVAKTYAPRMKWKKNQKGQWRPQLLPVGPLAYSVLGNLRASMEKQMSEVTKLEVRVNLVKNAESKVKAYASVSFELPIIGKYAVNHIKVVEGKNGLFISNPAQEKDRDGKKQYYDHHHPCTKEGREAWSALIMEKFEEELGKV